MAQLGTRERNVDLDAAKGLLILLVVIHHLLLFSPLPCKGMNDAVTNFVGSFFMPGFFLISGYCTSFDRKFPSFVWSNFKGLMVPFVCLGVLSHLITACSTMTVSGLSELVTLNYWTSMSYYWFLPALFLSKLVYWGLKKANIYIWAKYLIIIALGLWAINDSPLYDPYNFFCYKHSLIALFFVSLGDDVKAIASKKLLMIIGGLIFMALQISRIWMNKPSPSFGWFINMELIHYPVFLLLAITGTCLIICMGALMSKVKLVTFLGVSSLIVYCLHRPFIYLYFELVGHIESPFPTMAAMLVGFVFVVSACLLLSVALRMPYGKCLIGKW